MVFRRERQTSQILEICHHMAIFKHHFMTRVHVPKILFFGRIRVCILDLGSSEVRYGKGDCSYFTSQVKNEYCYVLLNIESTNTEGLCAE